MIVFIDDQREAHGIEVICKVLPIARRSTTTPFPTCCRDEVRAVLDADFRVYSVRNV
ncbi:MULTISPECIES: hypothetical protein [unclassified Mesorhizobium]|uniref:hypothetical protein n=1 Tax=unclassified Mesorhizobium TaxID=325217 RepID=UPI0004066ED5|nr:MULTISPECIES: hypothetical protein [unclassified Mesorhizobium]WJI44808.1 hypothetical protein NL532_30500 [Mesorhizobium sp. C120A]